MYTWIWRHLPGPVAARVAQALLLLGGAAAVLFLVVFPAVEPLLPYSDVTVDQGGQPTGRPSGQPTTSPRS